MEIKAPYAFGKTVRAPFDAVVTRVRAELAQEGFGILTEIDVAAKFREKLGKEFRRYLILGACNPALAYEVLTREPKVGTLLPCNVVVWEEEGGEVAVVAMDPVGAMEMIGNPEVAVVAAQVKERLSRALGRI